MVCLGTFSVNEFDTQWNSINPLFSSCFAASSRGACSGSIACGPVINSAVLITIRGGSGNLIVEFLIKSMFLF